MNKNLETVIAAVGVGLLAYWVMSQPQCKAACQQFFGSAANEAGKVATASSIALVAAGHMVSRRTHRRA